MKKIATISVVLLLAAVLVPAAAANGGPPVEYTFTFTDLGQPGAHGGGPLFADGTANGRMTLSALDGSWIVRLYAVSWSDVVPGQSIDVCFASEVIKGPPFRPLICLAALGLPLPTDGTPIVVPNPMGDQVLIRATPAG